MTQVNLKSEINNEKLKVGDWVEGPDRNLYIVSQNGFFDIGRSCCIEVSSDQESFRKLRRVTIHYWT